MDLCVAREVRELRVKVGHFFIGRVTTANRVGSIWFSLSSDELKSVIPKAVYGGICPGLLGIWYLLVEVPASKANFRTT